MRVVVTGATGFLGAHLVPALIDRGHEVIAFVRETSRTDALEARDVRVERGSLLDHRDAARVLAAADAVVHAAGGGLASDPRALHRANAETTRTLVEAAPVLHRFVLVSSLAAHGPSSATHPAREDEPDAPRSAYGASKLAAERIALAHRDRFGVTVLRPPALYGPGERRLLPLFRAARRGVVPLVHPAGTLSMLHGADCAEAIGRALEVEHPSGVYYVAEERIYTRREMVELVARAVGRRIRVVTLPAALLPAMGLLAELRRGRDGRPPLFSRDKAKDAGAAHQACDPRRAHQVLGWRSERDFEAGAIECLRSYEALGWWP